VSQFKIIAVFVFFRCVNFFFVDSVLTTFLQTHVLTWEDVPKYMTKITETGFVCLCIMQVVG